MKISFDKLGIIIVILCVMVTNSFGKTMFLSGDIKWITGSSANGLEVRLVRKDTKAVIAKAYTNETGSYAFYDIVGQPSDFLLQVYTRNTKKAEIDIPHLSIGGQVSNIIID